MPRLRVAGLIALGLVLAVPLAAQAPPADLVLLNGTFYTVDPDRPRAGAVAVFRDRIVAVGTNSEIRPRIGRSTRIVDLKGRFVVPGFVDDHTHFAQAGALLLGANLLRIHDQQGLRDQIAAVAERLPGESWIVGGDWGAYEAWEQGASGEASASKPAEQFVPTRQMIDDVSGSHPVLIRRFDRSMYLANSLALQKAGIDAETPNPVDGTIERDANGEPTGILTGTAVELVEAVIEEKPWEQRLAEGRRALAELRRYGVTSIHDITRRDQMRVYQELLRNGELSVRVWARPTLDMVEHLAAVGVETGFGNDMLKIGGLKGFVDGIMGNSSALFYEPYDHDPENSGKLRDMMYPEGNMLRLIREADRAHLVPNVHAIGDKAIAMLLDMYQTVIEENPPWDRRFRIIHSQVVGPDDFSRYGKLGIVAEVQPYHAIDDMRWMEERIGRERSRGAYAFKSLQMGGARLCFGTDWPGTNAAYYPANPLLGIYAAVTRKTMTGEPPGGWFPEQILTVPEAIEAYTMGSAWAAYEEEDKGSITPGKLADFAVLSRDITSIPHAEIKDVDVNMTILGGRIIFDQEKENADP
ncbi:MAG: amidohydrolase [Vicinamibacteria bacterium]